MRLARDSDDQSGPPSSTAAWRLAVSIWAVGDFRRRGEAPTGRRADSLLGCRPCGLTSFCCVARRRVGDARRDLIGAWHRPKQAVSAGCPLSVEVKGDGLMIVLGADMHKSSHSSIVAVDAATGQLMGEKTVAVGVRGFGVDLHGPPVDCVHVRPLRPPDARRPGRRRRVDGRLLGARVGVTGSVPVSVPAGARSRVTSGVEAGAGRSRKPLWAARSTEGSIPPPPLDRRTSGPFAALYRSGRWPRQRSPLLSAGQVGRPSGIGASSRG